MDAVNRTDVAANGAMRKRATPYKVFISIGCFMVY
jgi:hypothetical protein